MSFYNNREYKTRYDDSNYICEACNCNGKSSICKYDQLISWVYNSLIGSIVLTFCFKKKESVKTVQIIQREITANHANSTISMIPFKEHVKSAFAINMVF